MGMRGGKGGGEEGYVMQFNFFFSDLLEALFGDDACYASQLWILFWLDTYPSIEKMLFAGMCFLGIGGVSPLHNSPFTFKLMFCCDNQWPHKASAIFLLSVRPISFTSSPRNSMRVSCSSWNWRTDEDDWLVAPKQRNKSADDIFDNSTLETIGQCWPKHRKPKRILMNSKYIKLFKTIWKPSCLWWLKIPNWSWCSDENCNEMVLIVITFCLMSSLHKFLSAFILIEAKQGKTCWWYHDESSRHHAHVWWWRRSIFDAF